MVKGSFMMMDNKIGYSFNFQIVSGTIDRIFEWKSKDAKDSQMKVS